MELRARIQQIVLAHRRCYGYRRVNRDLADQGWRVNHKRVVRMMAEDNLLAVRRRKYIVTTESEHDLPVFRNLAATLQVDWNQSVMGGRYHLHSSAGAVFVSGGGAGRLFQARWWAGRWMKRWRPLWSAAALLQGHRRTQARVRLRPSLRPGRAVCLAWEYVDLLEQSGAVLSMSRAGCPWENSVAARASSRRSSRRRSMPGLTATRADPELAAHVEEFIERVLQSDSTALGPGLSVAGGVSSSSTHLRNRELGGCRQASEFSEASGNLSFRCSRSSRDQAGTSP